MSSNDVLLPTWQDFERLVGILTQQLRGIEFGVLLTITRAGVFPTALLSQHGAPDYFAQEVGPEWIIYPWDPKRENYE